MKLIKSLAAIFSGQNSKKKFLEAVQIEVCTSCNLDCMMCPLPEGGQGWSKKIHGLGNLSSGEGNYSPGPTSSPSGLGKTSSSSPYYGND